MATLPADPGHSWPVSKVMPFLGPLSLPTSGSGGGGGGRSIADRSGGKTPTGTSGSRSFRCPHAATKSVTSTNRPCSPRPSPSPSPSPLLQTFRVVKSGQVLKPGRKGSSHTITTRRLHDSPGQELRGCRGDTSTELPCPPHVAPPSAVCRVPDPDPRGRL